MCPPGVANGNQAAQQQQLVFGGNAVQPVQQVIAGAQQIAQQQAAQQPQQPQPQQQPQQPAQPAAQPPQQAPQPAQPGNGAAAQASAAHASARQAVADWGFAQPEVKASAAWQEALRKFAAAGPVIVTLGAVRRTLGPVHQRIRDAGNSHLLLVEDLYTLGPFRLSDLDGLPDETLVVIGPSTGRHYPVSAEWSLAVASETGRSWLDVYFGQRRVAMTGASTGMKSAAMWEGKDGLVGGLPFLSPSYDTYPVAAPGSKHNVFDLTDAEHRRINAAQMVGLEELGERIWEPTGAATLKAQLFYLSRGNMDNVVKGMIQVPGLPFPLPIALVLRDGEVHTVFHSMHETMAVHAECRFAVAGPALAAHAVAMGTPADAGALLRLLGAYGELFDPVDKALHSLPHLFGEASSGLRDTMQALADANAELPRVEAATSAAGGAGEQLFSAGKPVLGHACQLAMQLQEALVALKQMGKVDCAGLVPMAYAQAADRSFTLLAAWAAEAAPRRGGLLAHMRGGSSSGGSTSGSIPAPALPLETAAAAGAGGAAGTAGAAGAAPAADDEAARSFDQRFQLASQGRPALGRPARKSQDVLKQLDKLQRCGDEYVKQQRAAAPRGGTSGQRQQAAPRSRRSSGSGGGSGSGGRKRQQQRDHAGGTMLVPPPVAFGASAAAGAAAAAAGASRKRSHDSLAEDLLDAPEELSAAAAATAAGAPPAAPPAAPQPQRRIKRAKDSSRPVSGMAVTAGDARRAELRAVMTAVAGTHGDEDADSKLLQAVKAAYEVDPRRSSDSEALQRAARFAAIQAAVRATATGDGIGQKATCAAKAVEAGQMYAWLTPSLIEVFRPAYVKSSAKSGKEFVALLLKDPQLVQLLQAATQREKEQALALGGLLRLSQPLSLFFCEDELLWKNSRGDDGRFRGWLNNTMPKKANEEEEDEEAATRRSARGGSKNRTSQEESEEPSSTSEEEEDSSSGSEDEEEEEEEEAPAQRRASRRSTQTRAPQGVRRTGRQRAQVNYNVDAIEDDSEDLETSSCEEESEEEQEGRRRRRPTRRAAKARSFWLLGVDEEEEE
ncbi:hypothetical protein C2E21_6666 [Chlorella sorokiniana]|uniref:Uncharacterized protein n=1 Tax=Chlorella sorokiniana TaxID=3076 RepID=A0A2P6TJL8_CHLSO|nr:hypothetical protein C2E21_6666 [Chlorella sorokiniana]|eukprot:PRW44282.1 hypothetical protein C2E21_6666 [Chlorella sorokiniana]